MSRPPAGTQRGSMLVRVTADVYDELVKIQRVFFEEHQVRITLSEAVAQALADRKQAQP